MISNITEYEKAHADLRILEQRLADLEQRHPIGENGFTKASVRKMIAIINADLANFEGRERAVSGILHGLDDAAAGRMQPLGEAVTDIRRESQA